VAAKKGIGISAHRRHQSAGGISGGENGGAGSENGGGGGIENSAAAWRNGVQLGGARGIRT